MKWDLSTDEGLNAALCFFEAEHDPETARQLATYFYERLKNADVVSIHEPLFIRYFHTVMHRLVADGMKPEQAMGFALQRGKYAREDTESTDIRSAAYVVWARKQGKTRLEAIGEAANRVYGPDEGDKAVERAYKKYRAAFDGFPDEVLHKLFS